MSPQVAKRLHDKLKAAQADGAVLCGFADEVAPTGLQEVEADGEGGDGKEEEGLLRGLRAAHKKDVMVVFRRM